MAKRIEEQRVGLAMVKSERHFVQVGREMLGANAMPRTNDAALEQRECGFDRVGRDHKAIFVPDIFFGFVIDVLPLGTLRYRKARIVEDGFVGHDNVHILANVLAP